MNSIMEPVDENLVARAKGSRRKIQSMSLFKINFLSSFRPKKALKATHKLNFLDEGLQDTGEKEKKESNTPNRPEKFPFQRYLQK